MPHGYECDRCGEFVKQNGMVEAHPDLGGSLEEVRIDDPNQDSDSGRDINEYTLCEPCRGTLIAVIESE